MVLLNKAQVCILYAPAILCLSINPKLKTCTRIFTEVIFIIANKRGPKINNKKTVNVGSREKPNIKQIKNIPIINIFQEVKIEVVSVKQKQQNFTYKNQERAVGIKNKNSIKD